MDIATALTDRRSIKRFTARAVTRAELETLLDAATLAPNHRLTAPWRFYVLGPEARHAYGLALGDRKARKLPDPAAADAMRATVAAEHRALPAMLAVAMVEDANLETREEDFAATWMGIQNLALLAPSMGLGTAIRTGAVMADPVARAAVGAREGERIVALVHIGEPAEVPPAKRRPSAAEQTTWVP